MSEPALSPYDHPPQLAGRVALYDLSVMPTTFDFAVYAVMAKTLGYEEVRFVIGRGMTERKYPAVVGWRRWANICVPLCGIAGLKFSVGVDMHGDILGYKSGDIEALYKRLGKIEKLKPTYEMEKKGFVTVTMRNSFRNKWRNSNKADWMRVMKWLKEKGEEVIVLDECETQPMAVEQRLAFYSSAKMNLAVGNGPMVLCWLSDAPYLSFQLPKPPDAQEAYDALVRQWEIMKFPVGSQLSFRGPRQKIVWGPDDFDTITREWNEMFAETPEPVT